MPHMSISAQCLETCVTRSHSLTVLQRASITARAHDSYRKEVLDHTGDDSELRGRMRGPVSSRYAALPGLTASESTSPEQPLSPVRQLTPLRKSTGTAKVFVPKIPELIPEHRSEIEKDVNSDGRDDPLPKDVISQLPEQLQEATVTGVPQPAVHFCIQHTFLQGASTCWSMHGQLSTHTVATYRRSNSSERSYRSYLQLSPIDFCRVLSVGNMTPFRSNASRGTVFLQKRQTHQIRKLARRLTGGLLACRSRQVSCGSQALMMREWRLL